MINIQTPASRLNDPDTSHEAEKHINQGSRHKQQQIVLEAVKRFPNRTSQELSKDSGLDKEMVHKRLSELRTAKLVSVNGKRQCSITGRKAMVWEFTGSIFAHTKQAD